MPLKIALIVVDYQIDFISGSLTLSNGTAGENPIDALPHINALLSEYDKVALVVYTRDMHPPNHISFFENARNKDRELLPKYKDKELKMFEKVEFIGKKVPQVLYPAHCVKGTSGAEFQPEMIIVQDALYIDKGEDPLVESYSAFLDNERIVSTDLTDQLRERGIDAVILTGIAYDICVHATALDAIKYGFKTAVAYEACKGYSSDGIIRANLDFKANKIARLSTSDALKVIHQDLVPDEWQ